MQELKEFILQRMSTGKPDYEVSLHRFGYEYLSFAGIEQFKKELKNTWMRFRLWMTRSPEVMLLRESCPVYGDIMWVIGESSVK